MAGRVWRESDVKRDPSGKFIEISSAEFAKRHEIATLSQERDALEDRADKRLRWGAQATADVWFIPKGGAHYWVPREDKPAFIRGNYYIPSRPWPIVPPRDKWPRYDSYDGEAGRSVLSRDVPSDVWEAAHSSKPEPNESPRKDAHRARASVRGVLDDEVPAAKGITRIEIRKKRK